MIRTSALTPYSDGRRVRLDAFSLAGHDATPDERDSGCGKVLEGFSGRYISREMRRNAAICGSIAASLRTKCWG